jgi:hypothetical protein
MIRDNVGTSLEPPCRYSRKHLSLKGHRREDSVEGRYTVARDEEKGFLSAYNVANLASIDRSVPHDGIVEGGKDSS